MSEFRRRLMMQVEKEEPLPFGAKKIKYIECTGVQYIDTGFKHTNNTRFFCEMEFDNNSGTWKYPFGSYGGARNLKKMLCLETLQNYNAFGTYYSNVNKQIRVIPAGKHTIDLNKNVHTIDNSTQTYTIASFSSNYNDLIFGVTGYNGELILCGIDIKLYFFQIYENDELLYDFIPVRVEQVGYLYEKISKSLYGNAGTGDFILGNDI